MERTNGSKNVSVDIKNLLTPSNVLDLKVAVRRARRENKRIRAVGSNWSFSDCWATPDYLVDLTRLNKILAFSQGRNVWGHKNTGQTTDAGHESGVLGVLKEDVITSLGRRFVHVEAGIRIRELILALDTPGDDVTSPGTPARGRWALPTMGGASGQTLAGAIATGTHGGDFNLPPMAEMVRAIHLIAPSGESYWIERSGTFSITSVTTDQAQLVRLLTAIPNSMIRYDDDLFNAALVSMGCLGIVVAYVLEVRPQFGLSERVRDNLTWRAIRPLLASGDIFTGTRGMNWLEDHPRTLAAGRPAVSQSPQGLSIFINPYRLSDNYTTDATPDRRVMLVTHARSNEGFDAPHSRPGGPGSLTLLHLIKDFESAGNIGDVRKVIDRVINNLRAPQGTRGYPLASSLLDTTGTSYPSPPILSIEIAVSTVGEAHVKFIDRLLAISDALIEDYWRRGVKAKFAGGINLRYTRPTAALLGMQRRNAAATDERFCHIEMILMKEIDIFGGVHSGHHNMENYTEDWVRHFEQAATEFGARMHWGQLHSLNRFRVERSYPDTLPRWRRAQTALSSVASSSPLRKRSNGSPFSNWFSQRCGLEPYTEVLAATSWGTDRYDVFGFNESGEVLQLWWGGGGWVFTNFGNHFPDGERFTGPLTATSWGDNRIDVFGLGKRGTILQLWWENGWNWTDLSKSLPAIFRENIPLLGPLAVTSTGHARIDIFALAEGGQVWRFWYDSGGWHSQNLGNGFPAGERFVGSITAASWGHNRIDVFGLGTKGQVLQLWRQGSEDASWQWTDMSAQFPPDRVRITGPLTAISTGSDRIDIFCQSEKGGILRLYWDRGWYDEEVQSEFPNTVTKLGMPNEFGLTSSIDGHYQYQLRDRVRERFVGPMTVAHWPNRRLDIFGFGETGNVLQMWRENDSQRWNWTSLNNGWVRNREETVNSLLVDIRMGGQGMDTARPFRGDPSNAIGFVRLRDGREMAKDFSQDQEWGPFSLHTGTIELPSGTRLGDLETFGIRSLTAGPDHSADNWDINEVTVTFIGANGSGTLLSHSGAPLWYFQKNSNQVWAVPVMLP